MTLALRYVRCTSSVPILLQHLNARYKSPPMDSGGRVMVRKRSVVLGTLKTSVSLEDAFWERLKLVAAENRVHVRTYIASIAATGEHDNLSSALRLAVLEHFVAKAESSKIANALPTVPARWMDDRPSRPEFRITKPTALPGPTD
jgi:predicted DNA-binding ribbon-helix-helix protein